MRVEPGERRHQHEQRRARQMEVGHQHVDGLEAIAGRDEDRRLAGERPRSRRRRPRRVSSSRSEVVPTATMRPPARAHVVERLRRSRRETSPHSACMRVSAVSSALTGRNVPAPTCSVTKWRDDAARVQRRQQLGREMQARRRRGDGAVVARRRRSGSARSSLVRRRACRRCRAAAAWSPSAAIASSRYGAVRAERELDLAGLAYRRHGRIERAQQAARARRGRSGCDRRPPSRLAGRAKARQRLSSTRLCRLKDDLRPVVSRAPARPAAPRGSRACR